MSDRVKRSYWVLINEADMFDVFYDEYELVEEYEDGRVVYTGKTIRKDRRFNKR